MSEISPDRIYETDRKKVTLKKEYNNQSILDIGGGGDGIIGKLYGRNVIAVDRLVGEFKEVKNDSIKVVMDACDLSFVDNQFNIATAFFTLMYMENQEKEKCIKEVGRVLKEDGIFEIWDSNIPEYEGDLQDIYVLQLQVELPCEVVTTGYGILINNRQQDCLRLQELLTINGFKVLEVEEFSDGLFKIKSVKV